MLTKEDLKKIEELLQPKFDGIEKKLVEHDNKLANVEKELIEHGKRLTNIEKKLTEQDKKFVCIFDSLNDIDRRIINVVDIVSMHTELLKELNLSTVSSKGYSKQVQLNIQELYSEISVLSERVKKLEDKAGTYNMFLDKGKNSYTKILK